MVRRVVAALCACALGLCLGCGTGSNSDKPNPSNLEYNKEPGPSKRGEIPAPEKG